MMTQKYRDWINEQTLALARKKYPNNREQQYAYINGFLMAQLAQAMYNDSQAVSDFRRALKQQWPS